MNPDLARMRGWSTNDGVNWYSSGGGGSPRGPGTITAGQAGYYNQGRAAGSRTTVLPQGAGAAAAALNFGGLALSNPAMAGMLYDMGYAPTINGLYGGGWYGPNTGPNVPNNRTGNPKYWEAVKANALRGQANAIEELQNYGLMSGKSVPKNAKPVREGPYGYAIRYDNGAMDASLDAALIAKAQLEGGLGGGAQSGATGSAAGGAPALPSARLNLANLLSQRPTSAGGAAPSSAGGVTPSGGTITGSMSSPGINPPSIAHNYNPLDPHAATAAQEANRQAAIDTLRQFLAGIGNSALARRQESLASDLLANPESIDDATQQQIESRLIESHRDRERDLVRRLAEDLGASGQLGSGLGVSQINEARRLSNADLTRALRDAMIDRKLRGREERLQALAGGGAALGQLADIGGRTSSQIADILASTDIDDAALTNALFQMMFGMGGGYRSGGF